MEKLTTHQRKIMFHFRHNPFKSVTEESIYFKGTKRLPKALFDVAIEAGYWGYRPDLSKKAVAEYFLMDYFNGATNLSKNEINRLGEILKHHGLIIQNPNYPERPKSINDLGNMPKEKLEAVANFTPPYQSFLPPQKNIFQSIKIWFKSLLSSFTLKSKS
jgi:hypothetical protein